MASRTEKQVIKHIYISINYSRVVMGTYYSEGKGNSQKLELSTVNLVKSLRLLAFWALMAKVLLNRRDVPLKLPSK